jgi:hypothetical protein
LFCHLFAALKRRSSTDALRADYRAPLHCSFHAAPLSLRGLRRKELS